MKITTIESKTVALPIDNIDTDQIIPARFLKTTSMEGLGDNLFLDWRYLADGSPNPDFPLNKPSAKGATDPHHRRQFRLRQFARARAVGAGAIRIQGHHQHFLR